MEISSSKIEHPYGSEIQSVSDGSIRIIKYKTFTTDKPLAELSKLNNWEPNNRFALTVNLPIQRELDYFISIIKTSPNSIKVLYSDKKQTVIDSLKTLTEVNAYLKTLKQ